METFPTSYWETTVQPSWQLQQLQWQKAVEQGQCTWVHLETLIYYEKYYESKNDVDGGVDDFYHVSASVISTVGDDLHHVIYSFFCYCCVDDGLGPSVRVIEMTVGGCVAVCRLDLDHHLDDLCVFCVLSSVICVPGNGFCCDFCVVDDLDLDFYFGFVCFLILTVENVLAMRCWFGGVVVAQGGCLLWWCLYLRWVVMVLGNEFVQVGHFQELQNHQPRQEEAPLRLSCDQDCLGVELNLNLNYNYNGKELQALSVFFIINAHFN